MQSCSTGETAGSLTGYSPFVPAEIDGITERILTNPLLPALGESRGQSILRDTRGSDYGLRR